MKNFKNCKGKGKVTYNIRAIRITDNTNGGSKSQKVLYRYCTFTKRPWIPVQTTIPAKLSINIDRKKKQGI